MIADYWANGGRSPPISPQRKKSKRKSGASPFATQGERHSKINVLYQ